MAVTLDKNAFVELLRVASKAAPKRLVVCRILHDDERLDRSRFRPPQRVRLPTLGKGQQQDRRYTTNGREGLHEHVFDLYSEFHLDSVDPLRWPVRHLSTDTDFPKRAVGGAMMGLVGAAFVGLPLLGPMLAWGAMVSGGVKGRKPVVYSLTQLLERHDDEISDHRHIRDNS